MSCVLVQCPVSCPALSVWSVTAKVLKIMSSDFMLIFAMRTVFS